MTDGATWTRWPSNPPTITPWRASNTSDSSFHSVLPEGEHGVAAVAPVASSLMHFQADALSRWKEILDVFLK
jgi:hypothetical protein